MKYHLLADRKLPKKTDYYLCIMRVTRPNTACDVDYVPMICTFDVDTQKWHDTAYNNEYSLLNRAEMFAWAKIKTTMNITFNV